MGTQTHLNLGKHVSHGKDIFLCHTGADKPWVETLAEHIEAVRYKDRYLGVVFDKWDFGKGKNIVLEIERLIDECRFICQREGTLSRLWGEMRSRSAST
jgi:hypothetical protein